MWSLYRTIRPGIEKTKDGYLIDDIITMMRYLDESEFKSALRILYPKMIDWLKKTPLEIALLFTRGLKHIDIFHFHDFIKASTHGNPR